MKAREIVLWVVLIVLGVFIWNLVSARYGRRAAEVPYSELLARVDAGQIRSVIITGGQVRATTKAGETFESRAPSGYGNLIPRLLAKDVEVEIKEPQTAPWMTALYICGLATVPLITLIVVVLVLRQLRLLNARIDRLVGGQRPPEQP